MKVNITSVCSSATMFFLGHDVTGTRMDTVRLEGMLSIVGFGANVLRHGCAKILVWNQICWSRDRKESGHNRIMFPFCVQDCDELI